MLLELVANNPKLAPSSGLRLFILLRLFEHQETHSPLKVVEFHVYPAPLLPHKFVALVSVFGNDVNSRPLIENQDTQVTSPSVSYDLWVVCFICYNILYTSINIRNSFLALMELQVEIKGHYPYEKVLLLTCLSLSFILTCYFSYILLVDRIFI